MKNVSRLAFSTRRKGNTRKLQRILEFYHVASLGNTHTDVTPLLLSKITIYILIPPLYSLLPRTPNPKTHRRDKRPLPRKFFGFLAHTWRATTSLPSTIPKTLLPSFFPLPLISRNFFRVRNLSASTSYPRDKRHANKQHSLSSLQKRKKNSSSYRGARGVGVQDLAFH